MQIGREFGRRSLKIRSIINGNLLQCGIAVIVSAKCPLLVLLLNWPTAKLSESAKVTEAKPTAIRAIN